MARKDAKGNWIDPDGNPIPVKRVTPEEMREDALVMLAAESMVALSEAMKQAKIMILRKAEEMLTAQAEEHGEESLNPGGNYTWYDFSAQYKLQFKNAQLQQFDEHLQIAAQKLDRIIDTWAVGAQGQEELKSLATEAFEADQQGKISTSKVFRLLRRLRRLTAENAAVAEVVALIEQSVVIIGAKLYVSLSEKQADGSWRGVPVDFARA